MGQVLLLYQVLLDNPAQHALILLLLVLFLTTTITIIISNIIVFSILLDE